GFVIRHPARKTYHLGPAMIAAGNAAAKQEPRRELAREAMVRLGDELNITCWLTSADDTHIRVIDQAWRSRAVTPIMRVGERYRLVPPVGAVFMAWASDTRVTRWFDRGSIPEDQRPGYLDRLAEIRSQGYAVELEETPADLLRSLVTELANATTPAERSRLVDQLAPRVTPGSGSILVSPEPDVQYSVQSINAPVFDASGQVELSLGITNLPPLRGSRIGELAQRVQAYAAEVSAAR
ncbi:MAG: transcriptional regulator PadR family protein, partial [Acidimicrobiia bacterium]|nr:transcriptional regulator PadR family protein [Acidimicrobiia bacterium]